MKVLLKSLLSVGIMIMLSCLLCCTASATEMYSFETKHSDTNSNGNLFGADISYHVLSSETNEVTATIYKCYENEPVDIPKKVSYFDDETGDTTEYTIVSVTLEESEADKIQTLTVPDDLRTVVGNLFDFQKSINMYCDNNNTDYNHYRGSYIAIPNTTGVLASIPSFISDNYADGAYYAGKCLARVDPDYEGDFTVKDGTVCILASAFEGCKKLGAVTIPDSVEFIGMRAFANSSVTSVNIPAGLADHNNCIECLTFYGCKKLTNVSIDESVTLSIIGYSAFMNCKSLEGFDFTNVSYVEYLSFAGAFDSTKNVEISIRPSQLGNGAPFSRSGIKSVTFLENDPEKEYAINIPSCCFYKCKNLDTVVLSKSVKNFGAWCFYGCENLTSDILAQEDCCATCLQYCSFAATGLTEITIPATITDLNGGVFADTPSLKKVNYYSSYKGYPDSFFALLNDCSYGSINDYMTYVWTNSLKDDRYLDKPEKNGHTFIEELNIYCPDTVNWSVYFASQPYLKTVNIHNSAESDYTVTSSMFMGCPDLSSVNFDHPEKVAGIESSAFMFCPSLNSFPFEEMTNLKKIGSSAFMLANDGYGYFDKNEYELIKEMAEISEKYSELVGYGLQGELDLSKCTSLSEISDCAFQMQYNITGIKLPASITNNMSGVFIGCTSLKNITADCAPTYFKYKLGDNFTIKVSSRYKNYHGDIISYGVYNDVIENVTLNNVNKIDSISSSFFAVCPAIKNVTLKGISNLPSYMFVNCISLQNVDLPDTKTINSNTFFGAGKFKLNAPNAETVNSEAFQLSNVTDVYLPKVTFCGSNAFYSCNQITSISLPSVTTVGDQAFYGMENLQQVDLPSAETICDRVFNQCNSLTSVNLPSVTRLGDKAFFEVPKIKQIDLPSAKYIGDYAFFRCSNLESASLPSVEAFDSSDGQAFAFCTSLTNVELGDSLTYLGKETFFGSGIEKITIPGSLNNINKFAFSNCDSLKEVIIKDGVKNIDWFAFCDCDNLESVTLPETLETIGWASFKDCPNLKRIRIPASVTLIDDDAFAIQDFPVMPVSGAANSNKENTEETPLTVIFDGTPEIKTELADEDEVI